MRLFALPGPVALCLLVAGCGRVEQYELVDQPRIDDFETDIQPLLETMGCSRGGGCHTTALGGLALAMGPGRPGLEANYLGLKARARRDAPDDSRVLYYLLPQALDARAEHYPTCFATREACAYKMLRAWVAWKAPADPRPSEVCGPDEAVEPCP